MEIILDKHLKHAAPDVALGVVAADVEVTQHDVQLWAEIEQELAAISAAMSLDCLSEIPEIRSLRDAYRSLGKDPSRYRGSQESLFRRILQGRGLYQINTLVDINNLISLESRHSVGSYDLSRIETPIVFRVGRNGESYKGIGKDSINLDGLPVFADKAGPFGSPTSDSDRSLITLSTSRAVMLIISFSGVAELQKYIDRAVQLMGRYASVKKQSVTTFVVDQEW